MKFNCRSKDPSTCRFHGRAEKRNAKEIERAVESRDFSAYEKAREQVAQTPLSTPMEEAVRSVVGFRFGKWGFHQENELIAQIADVLESEENTKMGSEGASIAAEKVQHILWDRYRGGYMGGPALAPVSTCDLFHSLDRDDELGWIAIEASTPSWDGDESQPYSRQSYKVFLNQKQAEEKAS